MRRLLPFALFLFIAGSALAADDTIRRGFHVAEGGTLRLEAGVGKITIVTGGTGVAVEIVRDARGTYAEDLMRNHRIEFEQRGNDVIITSDLPDRDRRFSHDRSSRYDVEWNIRIPARYNVDASTSGGSIQLADIGGTVDVRTSGGSIRTGRLAGASTLRTSGGSIRIASAQADVVARTSGGSIHVGETAGKVEARTSGGSIEIAGAAGDVVARTSGGGIRIEDVRGSVEAHTSGGSIRARFSAQPRGDSELTTSGGGVTVALSPGVRFDLDARASGGGVRADVPVTVAGRIGRDSVRGQINGGGPKLVLRSSGGGIRVTEL